MAMDKCEIPINTYSYRPTYYLFNLFKITIMKQRRMRKKVDQAKYE